MNLARKILVRTPLLAALRARSRPYGCVLLYHRVVDPACHARIGRLVGTALPCATFERQLDYLAKHYRVVDLATLLSPAGRPAGSVAITFDDGYADILDHALPALRRRGMPATVFAIAGFVASRRRAWWDRLARLVAENGARPLPLRAGTGSTVIPFLGDAKDQYRRAARWLEPLPDEEREAVFAGRFVCDDDRFLEEHELRALERDGVRVEAHTVTHRRLSTLDENSVGDELARGKSMLEDMLGRSVEYLAYPFGMPADYAGAGRRLARHVGYRAAFAAHGGLLGPRCDRYALPRACAETSFDRFRIRLTRRPPVGERTRRRRGRCEDAAVRRPHSAAPAACGEALS